MHERLVGERITQDAGRRSEEHTSELQSLMRLSYAGFCLKKKKNNRKHNILLTFQPNHNNHNLPRHINRMDAIRNADDTKRQRYTNTHYNTYHLHHTLITNVSNTNIRHIIAPI